MAHTITKEEVSKIARLSNLSVCDEEINAVTRQLDSVLSYTARVKEVVGSVDDSMHGKIKSNKTRLDIIDQISSKELLVQVPSKEGNLIVVPMILEAN